MMNVSHEMEQQIRCARLEVQTSLTGDEFYVARARLTRAKAGEKVYTILVDDDNKITFTAN